MKKNIVSVVAIVAVALASFKKDAQKNPSSETTIISAQQKISSYIHLHNLDQKSLGQSVIQATGFSGLDSFNKKFITDSLGAPYITTIYEPVKIN